MSEFSRETLLNIIETDNVQCGEASALARMALAAMDQKPALHRYRRKAVEPYGPYPWHYEVFVDYPQPFEDIEDEYFYAAPPVVTGFAVDGESECLPLDYLQGHKDGLEWAAQLAEANHPETGDWLYDDPTALAKAIRKGPDMPPVQPVADREPDRNPVLAYADSYRDMAKQGVESVPIWSVITDLERNIAPLYRHAQPVSDGEQLAIENFRSAMEGIGHIRRTLEETFGGLHGTHVEPDVLAECKAICDAIYAAYRHAQPAPVVPNGLRLALSNAGIAAPESDEMLAATCEKHIQALVTWVKDRKSFQSAPVAPSFEEWISAANQKPIGRVKDAMRESCDACRAAMLAAAPHDTPALNSAQSVVTVPGTWIPVSERMPEKGQAVLVYRPKAHEGGDSDVRVAVYGRHNFEHGFGCYWEPSHWMPLPAAPQEVK